jgi:hypothetical protein
MAQHSPKSHHWTVTSAGCCLALLILSLPVAAFDPEVAAINRAKALLAARGYRIAPVVVLEDWPLTAASAEAFAVDGKIYVNARSNILRAAARLRAHDVVLASLLLHEQSHLLGANELQALEVELQWLTDERVGGDFIRETQRAIERERRLRRPSQPPREDRGRQSRD